MWTWALIHRWPRDVFFFVAKTENYKGEYFSLAIGQNIKFIWLILPDNISVPVLDHFVYFFFVSENNLYPSRYLILPLQCCTHFIRYKVLIKMSIFIWIFPGIKKKQLITLYFFAFPPVQVIGIQTTLFPFCFR